MTQTPDHRDFVDSLGDAARFDPHSRGLYATDASIYQVAPKGVIEARGLDQVVDAVKICAKHAIPVLPRGGGTSLAGQCVADAFVIDMSSGCDSILSIDPVAQLCRVEPGVTVDDLNDRLAEHELFFAPDPSTSRQATIGGCIGNNAAGAHSILFGRTSDSVISIDACLPSGERATFGPGSSRTNPNVLDINTRVAQVVLEHQELIDARYPKTLRRSAGYQLDIILQQLRENGARPEQLNLAPLLCGSEGTLALTLGAELKLYPVPKHKGLALVSYPSVLDAIDAVEPLLELGPASIELLDELILRLARENREYKGYLKLLPESNDGSLPQAVLYVEFFAYSRDELDEKLRRISDVLPGSAVKLITDPDEMGKAWKLRKAGEPLLHAIEGDRKPLGFIEDNAIPIENLRQFVVRLRKIIEREGTIASYYAHASVGVLHVRPLLDLRDRRDESAMHRIASATADLAKELGGIASGEHGDGRARGPFLERFFGPELMDAHRRIKQIFDPHNLLNPGNITDPKPIESISANTRVRPGSVDLTIEGFETGFRYDTEGGFAHAVEMCNGAGLCRKKTVGTMCPSYQGTREERHSTRGRGNALRRAITGQSALGDPGGAPDFNDPETLETLKLCLSCKACKTECPSSVDIAKLKSEYLHQHHNVNGAPISAKLFANVHTLNKLASLVPAVTNFTNTFAPTRSVLNHLLGLDPARSLPEFAKPFRPKPFTRSTKPKVVFVSDTMTTHTEPWIAEASVSVLKHLGYNVRVHTVSDLGRSAISQGLLDNAKRTAAKELHKLSTIISEHPGVPLLFVEPSMLSALSDDWGDLVDHSDRQQWESVAKSAHLIEDFVHQHWDDHPERVDPPQSESNISFRVHTHCHQKSLWGSESSLSALNRLAPGRVNLIDAGCCGMSGAFGYKHDTAPLANTIANQRLAPDVRAHAADSCIVAPGTSCRHMILDTTGVHALHPIEAVANMLGIRSTRPARVTPARRPDR